MTLEAQQATNEPSELDILRAEIAELKASMATQKAAEDKQAATIDELRRRNAVLRHDKDMPDPELRQHLLDDIRAKEDAVKEAEQAARRSPDNWALIRYNRSRKELKAAREQLEAQFPAPKPIERSLTRAQEQEKAELYAKYLPAKERFRKDTTDTTALLAYKEAERAVKKFWARCGMKMPPNG
jgi:hypothetical protein